MHDAFVAFLTGCLVGLVLGIATAAIFAAIGNSIERGDKKTMTPEEAEAIKKEMKTFSGEIDGMPIIALTTAEFIINAHTTGSEPKGQWVDIRQEDAR